MINSNSSVLDWPDEMWHKIFSNLSHKRVFFTFPQVSKKCTELIKNYRKVFEIQEEYWKKLCCEETYASWDGKTFEAIEKGPYLSWKKTYLASEPLNYIYKLRKYKKQKSICQNEIAFNGPYNFGLQSTYISVKKYFWGLTKQEIAAEASKNQLIIDSTIKLERIAKKIEKLSHPCNLEKTIIKTIGKNKFSEIPLFADCFQNKGIDVIDDFDYLASKYEEDHTFPNIVRGKTDSNLKFIFLHPQFIDKISSEIIGQHHIFIFSYENSFSDVSATRFPNGLGTNSMISGKGISEYTIEILQNFVLTGYSDYRALFAENSLLKLDFFSSI